MTTRAHIIQANAGRLPLADQSVDLTLCSPPYCDARLYLEGGSNKGIARRCVEWVTWMIDIVTELQRVTKGPVIVVAAGVTRQRNYWPACEGLMWEWWKRGGDCQLYRPVYWHRVGIPGSGGRDWFRADVEYCMCFKRPGPLPWSDNTACGHPPKWGPGGEMSNRLSDGRRVNQWRHSFNSGGTGAVGGRDNVTCTKPRPSHFQPGGNGGYRPNGTAKPRYFNGNGARKVDRTHTKREPDGTMQEQGYNVPVLANPGNLVKTRVGGGAMGHKLAHENEAPYPVKLCEFFIKSLCPPGGIVLDPFGGSGTTAHAAIINGRRAISSDLRASQTQLMHRRITDVLTAKPETPKRKRPITRPSEWLWELQETR